MKHKFLSFLAMTLVTVIFSSCEDFIETNLSNKNLVIITPADNATSSVFAQTFWWEELKGAEKYQLQIVKPAFSNIQQFITDTSVSGTKLIFTLQPGTYQWRIRAKNNSSVTEYITRTLTIDSTLNLSGQLLSLSLPADNHYSKTLMNSFSWQTMPNAQYYVLQLLDNGSVLNTQSSSSTSASYTFSSEGTYQWRVFAQNGTSNSAYYTRIITIDTTRPDIPTPLSPLLDTTSAEQVQLIWSDVETNISYKLQISDDSIFSLPILKDTIMSSTTYDLYNMTPGQYYYWKVKAIDKALNESAYFTKRKIKKN